MPPSHGSQTLARAGCIGATPRVPPTTSGVETFVPGHGAAATWREGVFRGLRPRRRHVHLPLHRPLTNRPNDNPRRGTARGPPLVVARLVTRLVARACTPFRWSRWGRFGRS